MPRLPLLVSLLVLTGYERRCCAVKFQSLALSESETRLQEQTSGLTSVQPRYWEDALRHSVYLTLVRDKIDELIAHDDDGPSDTDRYDLWDKINDASFRRLAIEEPTTHGDITLMARGRLFENGEKFQFIEDETKGKICKEPNCMEGVRALWSVKRTRRPDEDPRNYRYELTFSVITRIPQNRHSSPARTFTVRDKIPDTRTESFSRRVPLEPVEYEDSAGAHDGRAIWFHKNIVPLRKSQGRHLQLYDTDRIFSSFFINDEPDVWKPPTQKYSKIGYMGLPSHEQRKAMPYNYSPYKTTNLIQYSRLPSQSTVSYYQHQQLEKKLVPHFSQSTDQKNKTSPQSNPTRTPFLPTPLPTVSAGDKITPKISIIKKLQQLPNVTRTPEVTSVYVKSKPSLMKINYVTERIRPPVYYTPPGVFETMDRKPFKPMPPLRIQTYAKTKKVSKPLDFRPSPQVIDLEFSELNPLSESIFKPVNPFANILSNDRNETNYTISNTTKMDLEQFSNIIEHNKLQEKTVAEMQQNTTNITVTTTTSDKDQDLESMTWVNVLGAFSKTTPMESEKDAIDITTTATDTVTGLSLISQNVSTTIASSSTVRTIARYIPTTTPATKRRQLRPLHKFNNKKQEISSTKTEKSSASQSYFEIDLQSAHPVSRIAVTATTTEPMPEITTPSSFTSATVTTGGTASTAETVHTPLNNIVKVSNRYRQSTLMKKGTSVKRDKAINSLNTSVIKTGTVTSSQYQPRRNGSSFQGHNATVPEDLRIDESTDFYVPTTAQSTPLQGSIALKNISKITDQNNYTIPIYNQNKSEIGQYFEKNNEEKNNEVIISKNDNVTYTINQEITLNRTTTSVPQLENKNKTRCKKRKHTNVTKQNLHEITSYKVVTSTTTESSTTIDIFNEIFNALSYADTTNTNISSNETSTAEDYDYAEDASFNKKHNTFDSIDLSDDEDMYYNIHHKADHEDNSEERSTEAEYEDKVEKNTRDSESGERRYDDSQERDTPYEVLQLLLNETNQQLRLIA